MAETDINHEVLESLDFIAETTGCISIGTVVEIDYDTYLFVINVGGEEFTKIPVFYHCQMSNKANGIHAFNVGDEVIALHSVPDDDGNTSGHVVIGFADGELRLCKSPIIVVGYLDPSIDIQSFGRTIYNVDGGPCSDLIEYYVRGNIEFNQIRFLEEDLIYESKTGNLIWDDAVGEYLEEIVEVTSPYIFSLAIAKGYHINPGTDSTLYGTIEISSVNGHTWVVNKLSIVKIASGLSDSFGIHANFNDDKTKVYVVWGNMLPHGVPLFFPNHTQNGGFAYEVYDRVINDDGSINWELSDEGSRSFSYYVHQIYVENDGTVRGLWGCDYDGGVAITYHYKKTSINNDLIQDDDSCVASFTSSDDGFVPITISEHYDEAESTIPPYGEVNFALVHHTYLSFIDDNTQMEDNSDDICTYPVSCSLVCTEACYEKYLIDMKWKYWCWWYFRQDVGNPRYQSIGVDGSIFDYVEGEYLERYGQGESSPIYKYIQNCQGFVCSDPFCITIQTTYIYGGYKHDQNLIEYATPRHGFVNEFKDGSVKTNSNVTQIDPCVGECVCDRVYPGTDIDDCGCSGPTGGLYNSTYFNKIYNSCGNVLDSSGADDEEIYVDENNIVYPFNVSNSVGIRSFKAIDQNSLTNKFTGLVYIEDLDDQKIMIKNGLGVDISSDVMGCSGFDSTTLHYMAFLF